ncbi:LysR family transcriptional regulator [Primorskyibacter flagellatus]|uniref:LysR family transcriptional regulator, glycine cleavage system transcriptional activator n=1 Tax=Primorskyibacter flagellatus TaxID=1387277 RepID=A0A1W1ZNL6_9RHOB|nr:LysR family transcriptional regulator [Primorskyibacter flagellatus]SMC50160.1 LysR family transcriptional regulator, glycine cleavage system transcriptional activator [Primorskyibacter flagellatus]
MDWRSLPPLSALRAFSAYAETGSVVAAGSALNVSHAAISQQLRSLETHMDVRLLDRSGRTLALTAEGQQLADALAAGFGRIWQTVEALTGAHASRALQVATTPSFASHWLMPRLASFRVAHPDIDIMINPSPALTDPTPGGVDVALRYGAGKWPGLEAEMLVPSSLMVVAAPSLIGDFFPTRPQELTDYPWLQELGTTESSHWLARHGVTDTRVKGVIHVPGNLMLDGARNGQGIAVSTRVSVEEDIRAGRLRLLFEDKQDEGYHIVTAPGIIRPALRDFIHWLRREARNR